MDNDENYPKVKITKRMIKSAKEQVSKVKVDRTVASDIDTLTGIIGEYVFAEYYYNDWRKNNVGENKGDFNFEDLEIKTSAFPFNENLNLLVREDYAKKRKPPYYVQIIIDVSDKEADEIKPGTEAYICGFATAEEVDDSPKRDFGSKYGGEGGYRCHYISIKNLNPMSEFEKEYHTESN